MPAPDQPGQAKRPIEDADASSQRQRTTIGAAAAAAPPTHDEEMGEFEDQFEDEFDEEDIVGEGETMDIDGVPVDGTIQRPDGEDDEEAAPEELQTYIPGQHADVPLEPDQSAYEMLHRLNVTWPCLSFDHLRDQLGDQRQSYPHTSYMVAGTQADIASRNELMVLKASSLHRTQHDDGNSDDEEDDDDLDDDAILEYKSIPVVGGINRVRAAPVDPAASLDPYPVAVWSELGDVKIFDVRSLLNSLDRPGSFATKVTDPTYTVRAHKGVEGYAMDWASTGLRLLTGDIHSKIFLTTPNNTGFQTNPNPFSSHTSSVEDLQWSPTESTVFASCSADRSIRVWDVRLKSRKSVVATEDAHDQDVNVINWNKATDYLLLSGGEEGALKVWDLRHFGKAPVANFDWHKGPISSVEWHPTEDSVFAAAGRDNQVTLWDLSVEADDDEQSENVDVPAQLLFCHHGITDCKELHWHPQIPGMVTTTSLDGFNMFKTISV